MAETKPPKVFISYAWEDDIKTWMLDFATRLRSDGINAILDQWETVPGDQLPEFMEKSVRESDFVVFVCTPTYKRKSDRRKGGVGYEGHIITGEVFQKNNHRKFIPVLRKGKWASAAPSWATSKLFIDFRGEPYSEASYQHLLDTLFGKSPTAPPLRDDTLREKVVREVAEKEEREKKEYEIAERKANEIAEKEAKEKTERERIALEAHERTERETATKSVKNQLLPKRKLNLRKLIANSAMVFLAVTAVLAIILPSLNLLSQRTEPTPTHSINSTEPVQVITSPTLTLLVGETSTLIQTQIDTITPTTLPTEITDAKGVQMVLVPSGEFTMGSDLSDALIECQKHYLYCYDGKQFADGEPPHKVHIDSFYMDKYEVNNAHYKTCVDTGVCDPPHEVSSAYRLIYYESVEFDNYPVINIDWFQAKAYCEWRGAELPTEAQWEKAARGTDQRTYSWGEGLNCSKANYVGCGTDTNEVGKFESGKSPYGIYDMIGNVSEWVADWYLATYYQDSSTSNPLGPTSGQSRVLRGGSYYDYVGQLLVSNRSADNPNTYQNNLGFRCAKDATP